MFRGQTSPKPLPVAAARVGVMVAPATVTSSPRELFALPAARAVFGVVVAALCALRHPFAPLALLQGTGSTWHLVVTRDVSQPWLGRMVEGAALFARIRSLSDLDGLSMQVQLGAFDRTEARWLLEGSCEDATSMSLGALASLVKAVEGPALRLVTPTWEATLRTERLRAVLAAWCTRGDAEATLAVIRTVTVAESRVVVFEGYDMIAVVDDESDPELVDAGRAFVVRGGR